MDSRDLNATYAVLPATPDSADPADVRSTALPQRSGTGLVTSFAINSASTSYSDFSHIMSEMQSENLNPLHTDHTLNPAHGQNSNSSQGQVFLHSGTASGRSSSLSFQPAHTHGSHHHHSSHGHEVGHQPHSHSHPQEAAVEELLEQQLQEQQLLSMFAAAGSAAAASQEVPGDEADEASSAHRHAGPGVGSRTGVHIRCHGAEALLAPDAGADVVPPAVSGDAGTEHASRPERDNAPTGSASVDGTGEVTALPRNSQQAREAVDIDSASGDRAQTATASVRSSQPPGQQRAQHTGSWWSGMLGWFAIFVAVLLSLAVLPVTLPLVAVALCAMAVLGWFGISLHSLTSLLMTADTTELGDTSWKQLYKS
ncbi:MAG: hypothetical protein WDW38_001624 [Sanguina aurantia]